MSDFSKISTTIASAEKQQSAEDATSSFRRRTFNNSRCLLPRRYVIALLFFLLVVLTEVRKMHADYTLHHVILFKVTGHDVHNSLRYWIFREYDNIMTGMLVADIISQIIGALLIYVFPSHKFLLVAVTASSILYMFIPAALYQKSIKILSCVLLGPQVISAPIGIAIFSTWKDWAPQNERPGLFVFSFLAMFGEMFFRMLRLTDMPFISQTVSFYLLGSAGIIWVLFWYAITSETPQSDPLISENEFLYLQSNIPSDNTEKRKLKNVPWISIMKATQVVILCLIFFKLSFSMEAILIASLFFKSTTKNEKYVQNVFDIRIFTIVFPLILVGSAVFMDFLIKKYSNKAAIIKKSFICVACALQCLFLLGTLSSSGRVTVIFYILAYCAFAPSVPGFISYPLDLSPRYVPITAGIGFIFYSLGDLIFELFVSIMFNERKEYAATWLFLFDGTLTLVVTIAYGFWGNTEEQRWSLSSTSKPKEKSCNYYPDPDVEEQLNLVSEMS